MKIVEMTIPFSKQWGASFFFFLQPIDMIENNFSHDFHCERKIFRFFYQKESTATLSLKKLCQTFSHCPTNVNFIIHRDNKCVRKRTIYFAWNFSLSFSWWQQEGDGDDERDREKKKNKVWARDHPFRTGSCRSVALQERRIATITIKKIKKKK